MAAACARHAICVLLIFLLLQFVEPRLKTRRASASGATPTPSSQPSGWENFIRKVQKPFRTVDSAFLLLGVSKSFSQGVGRHYPITTESTTTKTSESMGRMLMDPTIKTTPKSIPVVTKPVTPSPPQAGDTAAWNLLRLSNDPCGASPTNITDGEMQFLLGQYPWLALLRFSDENKTMENLCGGSLISDRYVLTTASCLSAPGYKLTNVRLGEYNLDFYEADCSEVEEGFNDVVAIEACYGNPPVDYAISSTHAHPKYDPISGEFNVALIRLAKKVEYTPLISPVCLPVGNMAVSWNIGISTSDLILAGWGVNLVPREAFVYDADPSECEDATGDHVFEGQMCGMGVDGSDLCHGDLGGPLFTLLEMKSHPRGGSENTNAQPAKRYVQLGLLTSKSAYCEDEPPLIFDSVERFLSWILVTMKP